MLLLGGAMILSACSDSSVGSEETPAKADLQEVVATGEVKPVNGITPAGQPDAAAFKVFADNGYVAVIDLRTVGEDRGLDEQTVVEGLGMTYVLFPISSGDITFENAQVLDGLLASFDDPVLLHCASSNRVGALLALRASLHGADDPAALQAGKQGGMTRLEPKVRELLSDD